MARTAPHIIQARIAQAKAMLQAGGHTRKEILALCHLSKGAYYRHVQTCPEQHLLNMAPVDRSASRTMLAEGPPPALKQLERYLAQRQVGTRWYDGTYSDSDGRCYFDLTPSAVDQVRHVAHTYGIPTCKQSVDPHIEIHYIPTTTTTSERKERKEVKTHDT